MIARQLNTDIPETGEDQFQPSPRLRDQISPIGHLLSQNLLDEAVRSLQEDLAMLQAEQQRGLNSLGGALDHLNHEVGAVRSQLSLLTEPRLLAQQTPVAAPSDAEASPDDTRDSRYPSRAETDLQFDRIEKQIALLMRGMDAVDVLRYQSDVHTRALARLTDLLGEVVKPRQPEGFAELELAVRTMESSQRRSARTQLMAFSILGLGLAPGIGALTWMILRATGSL
jgi:hypothetical protein